MNSVQTRFISRTNGFLFVNSFPFPFSTTFKLPFVGNVDLGQVIYGLCGGMCFASLDYFYKELPIPKIKSVENIDTAYLLYLWDRQLDSFGLVVVPKVIEWMIRDDIDIARRTAYYEIPKMKRRLDKGQPTVLALIRSRAHQGNATQNHQVLATGYDEDPTTKSLVVHLYDPNHPGDSPTLNFDLTRPSSGINPRQSTGENLRGFFIIQYHPQNPPEQPDF